MRAVGELVGATVNDVGLAVCGGALRRFLLESGQLPVQSLRALVPVALARTGDELGGNVASAVTVALRTDIGDPSRRLALIALATRAAKAALRNAPATVSAGGRGG